MSLGTFLQADVETLLAGSADLISGQTTANVSAAARILYDEVDAALVAAGEATFTDATTDRVVFSAGGKAFLDRLRNADPLNWDPKAPFIRAAQLEIDGLLATVASTDGDFTPASAITTSDPDAATIAANILSTAEETTTQLLVTARNAIAAAFEKFSSTCVPARVGNAWTFTTTPKAVMAVMTGGTPTVLPTAVFQAEYDRLKALFEGTVTPGIKHSTDAAV